MSSAREIARTQAMYSGGLYSRASADAASDVWEPLVAKLKIALRVTLRHLDDHEDRLEFNRGAVEALLVEADAATDFNPYADENLEWDRG